MRTIMVGLLLLIPALLSAQSFTMDQFLTEMQFNYVQSYDSTIPAGYTTPGAGRTWDMTDLAGATTDTLLGETLVEAPFPYSDSFPTATMCTQSRDGSAYQYYRIEGSSTAWILGSVSLSGGASYAIYHPGMLLQFPVTMSSHWTYVDTMYMQYGGMAIPLIFNNTIDGWATGTARTPYGDYPILVTKQHMQGTLTIPGFTQTMDYTYYQGWNETSGEVAHWDSLATTAGGRTTVTMSRTARMPLGTGVTRSVEPKLSPLTLSPNPASSIVRVDLPGNEGRVRVFDLEGHQVLDRVVGNSCDLDISGLANGVYNVKWVSGSARQSTRLIVAH